VKRSCERYEIEEENNTKNRERVREREGERTARVDGR